MKNINNNDNTVINNKTKETINMKKSVRNFESILASAKKQEKQLDAARKAWAAAKSPSTKKLAQKAGEDAKKNLAALREEWKIAKTAQTAPATQQPVAKKEVVVTKPAGNAWENQLVRARQAWAKAKAAGDTRGMETARKAGEQAKAKLAGATAEAQPAKEVAPITTKPVVTNKEVELKAKYHELKVSGINELVAEYRKEEEALKSKYAAKKQELVNGLLKLYKEELADMSKEAQPSVMEEVVEHLKAEVPCSDLKEELKEELELIAAMDDSEPAEDSSFVPVPVDGKKDILVEGSVFKSGSGNCYYVNTQFNRAAYMAADSKGKQRLINAAIKAGDIKKVEKQDENLLFPCDNIIDEREEASIETAPVFVEAPVTESKEADAVNETPAVEKVEVNVDPELDSIAASAMESDSDTRLNCGETFLDENGNVYAVDTFFEYTVFAVSDRAVQQQMIQEALTNGDIRMVKKAAA